MQPLRVALVGVGRRGTGVWLPVIRALRDSATLVAVGNRGASRGKDAADSAGAPWFTDVETLLKEAQPQILVAAVNPPEIPNVSLPALERGVSVITETPLAPTLEDADRMIEAAKESGALLEVAENFYRAPAERLKGAMIAEGVFGWVWRTFNDHRTHNYHAASIIRSYIGFDVPVRRVTGWQQVFPTAEREAWKSSGTSAAERMLTSPGSREEIARRMPSVGMARFGEWKLATWPSAWTPASVRPAPCSTTR